MPLTLLARFLIIGGGALLGLGLLFALVAHFFPSGVPGDIAVRRGNVSFFFPIVSCIVLSIVGTVLLNIVLRFLR